MRMHLHLECFQLRLHELRAKLRSFQLTFPVAVVVTERVTHQQYRPVDEQPFFKVQVRKTKDSESCDICCQVKDDHQRQIMKREQNDAQDYAEDKVKSTAAQPIMALKAIPAREPENERRSKRPEVAG